MSELRHEILEGNPVELLKGLPAEYFTAVITFPSPVNCSNLDDFNRYSFASKDEGYWRLVMRTLRPGAFILAISDIKDIGLHGMVLRMAKAEIRDKIDYYMDNPCALDFMDFRRYIVKLVSPPQGGIILDPFYRDNLTLEACKLECQSYVGIRKA